MIRLFPRALAALLILAAAGCEHPTKVSKKELVAYINNPDNDLVQKNEVNGIQVRVAYKPSSLLVLQDWMTGRGGIVLLLKSWKRNTEASIILR